MPRKRTPQWGRRADYELADIAEFRNSAEDIAGQIGKGGDSSTIETLAWDMSKVQGWLSLDDRRPRRSEQAAALREVARSALATAQILSKAAPAGQPRPEPTGSDHDGNPLSPVHLLFTLPIELEGLARAIARRRATDESELEAALRRTALLLSLLDDFSQQCLFDHLMTTPHLGLIDQSNYPKALTLIATAAEKSVDSLSSGGRDRPHELHASVSYLLDRYQELTEEEPSYYVDDDDQLASKAGQFVIDMLSAAGSHRRSSTIANVVELYCRSRNRTR